MIPKGVRGNKRSQVEINKIKKRIRTLLYSLDPIYRDEEILAILKIPQRTYDRYKSQIWKEDAPKKEQIVVKEAEAKNRKSEGVKKGGKTAGRSRKKEEQLSDKLSPSNETRDKLASYFGDSVDSSESVDTSFDALNKLKNLVQVKVFEGPKPQVMKVY